jgi:uncharacterized phage-associated protein
MTVLRRGGNMRIKFTMNERKTVEAIVWIVRRGERNLYNIMKILFAADKWHLNTYTRPVTGDRYVAMRHGTVPSFAYSVTKLSGLGFSVEDNMLSADEGRVPDMEQFSESDVEALEHGYGEYASLTFAQVQDKNHEEKAWVLARKREPGSEAPDIWFEDMIEDPDLFEHLDGIAQFVVI